MNNRLNEANRILTELQDYKSKILDSIQENLLKQYLTDYYRLLDIFEEDLIDCIDLYKKDELSKSGLDEMSWLISVLKGIV